MHNSTRSVLQMNKSIDICIMTYNRREQLLVTLENAIQQLGDLANIFVLDNGSDDGTEEAVRRTIYFEQIKYIKSNINRGVCRGRNLLWRISSAEFILSLDDDIIFSRDSALRMIDLCRSDPSTAIVSPLIVNSETARIHNPIRKEYAHDIRLYEACFLLKRTALKRIGYLDRRLKYAGEGLDFAQRVLRFKYKIIRAPDVSVLHYDRVRSETHEAERRLAWVWSFACVYSKNFSSVRAILLITRNCAAHVRSGTRLFGLGFAFSIPGYAWNGLHAGWAAKTRNSRRLKTLWSSAR